MARKGTGRKRTKFSGKSTISVWGISDTIKKLNELNVNVDKAIKRALPKAMEIPYLELKNFMSPGAHYITGDTLKTLILSDVRKTGTQYIIKTGFDLVNNNNALPALFLDIGTPWIKPSFFVYYAFHNSNAEKINNVINNALKDCLKDAQREIEK